MSKHITKKPQWEKEASHVLDEELGQAVWISQTFLQLSQEVAAMAARDGGPVAAAGERRCEMSEINGYDCVIDRNELEKDKRRRSDSLFVPVVDLVDVSKHHPVFSPHIFWNSLTSHCGHVALHTHTHTHSFPFWGFAGN